VTDGYADVTKHIVMIEVLGESEGACFKCDELSDSFCSGDPAWAPKKLG